MDKNYITPSGYRKLQNELYELVHNERPQVTETVSWAAGNGDRSENGDYLYGKRRLREIDSRIRYLNKQLDASEVVDPTKIVASDIRFGATVTIRFEDNQTKTFAIVGVDESDIEQGKMSWKAPLARAILRKKIDDCVTFTSPKGLQDIEILDVQYVEIA